MTRAKMVGSEERSSKASTGRFPLLLRTNYKPSLHSSSASQGIDGASCERSSTPEMETNKDPPAATTRILPNAPVVLG